MVTDRNFFVADAKKYLIIDEEFTLMIIKLSHSPVEHAFLSYIVDNKVPVKIFFKNGFGINGWIYSFDEESIYLINKHRYQSVNKSNIATVVPLEK